ncbi:MAG: RNA 3'-terminal phosphate cyclase [Armatimonadota bacterium]|nr:RNA 3'-terminal phosphate cyclase [Armatimonadota bacterium]
MVTIDGSYGEGGGQVLRTSLALSALLGRELRIHSIRAGRSKPGLAAQHLAAVRAAAQVCSAEVDGASMGSRELTFRPREPRSGDYRFEIGTAGATTLVLQTVLPPLLFAKGSSLVRIHGGTNVRWSPPQEYIAEVFLPAVAGMGASAELQCLTPGFYPRGGGCIEARVSPLSGALEPLRWRERGELSSLTAFSVVEARLPSHIIRRQIEGAREALGSAGMRTETAHPESASPGTMLMIVAGFERGRGGFTALGERGKPAEEVGGEAGQQARRFLDGGASVDCHLGDQLLLYAAIAAGETTYVTEEVTEHLRTNAWVIEQFLDVDLSLNERTGEVAVSGAGLPAA